MDQIERMFNEEIRDKKRTARGSFSNSGRRGGGTKGVRSVKTAADVLKYNDKAAYKLYVKASDVIMSNVYDDILNIPTVAEIKEKDFNSAQSIVKAAKLGHTMKDLSNHWHLSGYSLYKLFDDYEIEYPKHPRKKTIKKEKDIKKANYIQKQEEIFQQANLLNDQRMAFVAPTLLATEEPKEEEEFQLKYIKKEVTGVEAQDRIMNYMGILMKDKKYDVKLTITELPEKE